MAEMVLSADEADGAYVADLSSFSPDQITQFREMFASVDTNNDGTVSSKELKDMFNGLGFKISRKILRRLIRTVDADRSGNLSFEEFISLILLVTEALQEGASTEDEVYAVDMSQFSNDEIEYFETIFEIVDADSSGTVSTSELYDMLIALNYEVSHETLSSMVTAVDSDLSGDLSFEEFVTLLILINQMNTESGNDNSKPSAETFEVDISKFPREDIERFFLTFKSVDADGDGNLSVLELYDMFLALGYPVTVEKVSEVLQLVDADGNGNLSFKEFVALIVLLSNEEQQQSQGASVELSEEDHARFSALFASVDTDGSGSISTSELGNLFSEEGYDTSEEEMRALISLVDIDQDGMLNFEEFVQLILLYLESKQQQRG